MNRLTPLTMAMVAVTFCGQAWLGTVAQAQTGPVTDTFELKVTTKEFCEGNPKFFENIRVTVKDGATFTMTRDVNGTGDFTDIQATINSNGGSADIDAMTLNGLAFRRLNKLLTPVGPTEFVLSGVNPGNTDHFLTIRGQATLDKFGNLTKVTGTFVYQITGTYTTDKKTGAQSGPVECFASGTIGTGKKILGT
jgi:hypothetical protein